MARVPFSGPRFADHGSMGPPWRPLSVNARYCHRGGGAGRSAHPSSKSLSHRAHRARSWTCYTGALIGASHFHFSKGPVLRALRGAAGAGGGGGRNPAGRSPQRLCQLSPGRSPSHPVLKLPPLGEAGREAAPGPDSLRAVRAQAAAGAAVGKAGGGVGLNPPLVSSEGRAPVSPWEPQRARLLQRSLRPTPRGRLNKRWEPSHPLEAFTSKKPHAKKKLPMRKTGMTSGRGQEPQPVLLASGPQTDSSYPGPASASLPLPLPPALGQLPPGHLPVETLQ